MVPGSSLRYATATATATATVTKASRSGAESRGAADSDEPPF